MKPKIIEECLEVLRVLTNRNVEDIALQNMLNAKLANMVCLKGCAFKQFANSKPSTVSYYAMNFMNSGARKDYSIDSINNYLLGFVKPEIENKVENLRSEIEQELEHIDPKKNKREYSKKESELDSIRVASFELENPNYSGLYSEAKQIARLNFGGIFIRISELGDYLSEIVGGDASKKKLYNSLKNIFEGKIAPNIIQGDNTRETLTNIPIQVVMYTDYENLFDRHVKDYYVKNLKTGMARRSFIYMPKEQTTKMNYPSRHEENEEAIYKAVEVCKKLENIYRQIRENTIYEFSEEAKDMLYEYQCRCIDSFNNSKDELILKIEKNESFWKCTKLAVIYSIIDNPLSTVVESKYVIMALDFYDEISYGLKSVINKREKTNCEKVADFFINHIGQSFTTMELRNAGIIGQNNFSDWWNKRGGEAETIEELQEAYKIDLVKWKVGKATYYKAVANELMPVADENCIEISISHDKKNKAPTENFEFRNISMKEFEYEIKQGSGFCAGKLKNEYRADENYLGEQKTIWLDFENQISIEDAKKLFKDYWYVIYTTRNHKIKGTGDRFRIVLKINDTLPVRKENYERIMGNIIKNYDCDIKCKNPSRFYYGNPNAEFYHQDGAYFDWHKFDYVPKVEAPVKKSEHKVKVPTNNDNQEITDGQVLTDDNIFTAFGSKVLRVDNITQGNRDMALAETVGILIGAVQGGKLSHQNALSWLDDVLSQITSKDFKDNAQKYRKRLENLQF